MPRHPGPQPSRGRVGDHAVVLGGSLAGLLAARVLADAYVQVTMIDRDQLPQASIHRRGVPHGRHVHALLARGQQALEELFPGLTAELVTHGVPADALGGDLAILHGGTPEHPRGGALLMVEGDRWMVTLGGILGDHPPTDPDGFLDYARSLQFPDIYETIRDAEPLDDPVPFRFPASVRHRYERLNRFPDGLLVVGDAVCSFNPIYGQGMSVAAVEALALRRHLERGAAPRPRHFFRGIARLVDVPWDIAAGGDLVFAGVQVVARPDRGGQRGIRAVGRYRRQQFCAHRCDPPFITFRGTRMPSLKTIRGALQG